MADDAPVQLSRKLPLDAIVVPERLRPVDEAWVEALAASMSEGGQIEPIVVRALAPLQPDRYALVAGAHRLAAARRLEWAAIDADVRVLGELEARLVEIDENLMRRELSALDRAVFLAERKRVWEGLHPQTRHGGDRKSRKNKVENQVANSATRFSEDAADRTGLSERSVQAAVALATAFTPAEIARIRRTYLVDHATDLAALAALRRDDRATALAALESGEARTIRTYRVSEATKSPRSGPAEKLFDLWTRTKDRDERVKFLRRLTDDVAIIEALAGPSKYTSRLRRGDGARAA